MKRNEILETAKNELGTKESPSNSNIIKYGDWYGLNGQKWCAMFVSWVFYKTGIPLGNVQTKKGIHHCQAAHNYYKSKGLLTSEPLLGDLVLYDWEGNGYADHIGIFIKWIDATKEFFEAYEGNTSVGNNSDGGSVMMRIRSRNLVKSFVNPGVYLDIDVAEIPKILTIGSRGADVTQVQKHLYFLGYEILVDGWFGTQTETFIKKFQIINLMTASGKVDDITFGAIVEDCNMHKIAKSNFISASFLKKGNTGFMVVELQRALKVKEPKLKLPITGVFDNPTYLAVKEFQKECKIDIDGIVGPKTFGKLGLV